MARLKKLRPEHALELKAFLALQPDQRKRLSAIIDDAAPVVAASQLLKRFVEVVPDREVARHVLRQLLFVAEYVRNNQCTSSDALSDVVKALEKDSQWTKEEIHSLSGLLDWIKNTADSRAIYGSAKAMTLSFDTPTSISEVRIITDIRPVFDRSRETMLGGTILNELRIDYSEGNEDRSISLALSLEDLKKIRSLIEDAISKSLLSQRWLEAPSPTTSFVRGEETYGFD